MRVLAACSLGGAGHLQPLRPFLDAARDRGAETLVVGPPGIAELVEDIGHPFVAGGEPPESEIAPIRERLPVAPAAEASRLGNRELFGRLATAAMLPAMTEAVADWAPDLVLREPCEYSSAIVADQRGTAVAQVAIGLAAVEWGSIAVASPALDEHRSGLADVVSRTPYLTRFPGALDPSGFADTRRFSEPEARSEPLEDWWKGSTAPLVYVSFGTVLGHMTAAVGAYRTVLAAVAELDARVLLTVGRKFDIGALGDVPDHVHVEPWVDQGRVLGAADLVICHGGSGTTFGALAAGVPVVLVPMFADQFSNARAVAEVRAGIAVRDSLDTGTEHTMLSFRDARAIRTAVETVRDDPSFRRQAQRIAAEMADAPTVGERLDELVR